MKVLFALPILFAALVSCNSGKKTEPREVYVDDNFTKLYMVDSGGITGGDGTISIVLADGSSLFLNGDSFAGEVIDGRRDPSTPMLNNSLIHISKDYRNLGSYYGGTKENPVSLCAPLEAATHDRPFWYWPGDGLQNGNTLHLFMTKFYQEEDGQWGFRFRGTDYVKIDMDDYTVITQEEIFDRDCPVHWGHCVMYDDGYYYVYGTRSGIYADPAALCVARATMNKDENKLDNYEYFDGEGWTATASTAADLLGTDISVSEQFSVFRHGDKYVLLTQRRAQQAGDIYSFISENPYGPWYNKKLLYTTTEQNENPNLFTYNSMAHPQFINEADELLICYNVNSYDLDEPFRDVSTYRPVFLRVPMEIILD